MLSCNPHAKVIDLPEGLDFEPLAKVPEKESKPVVVFAGRLKRAKRSDHAIRAYKVVKAKVPQAKLWVLGDGPFRAELERTAGAGVRFFGRLNNVERRELIRRSWVLVNPSIREGWGLNVVETNALGTPCVVYDVAGLRDSVKNNENGLIAEASDIEDLAAKIVMVLEDEVLRNKLSWKALDTCRRFDWNNTVDEFMKIVKEVKRA